MSGIFNPSTIWSQLSTPTSPAGAIPFIASDNVTPIIDVLNFFYDATLLQLKVAGGLKVGYTDSTAVPGAATINKPAGRVKLSAGQTSLVVTNSLVAATSIIKLQLETADATLIRVIPVPAAGSFTITGNAAATAAVTITFEVLTVY